MRKYNTRTDDQQDEYQQHVLCTRCGGQEQLAVIFKQLLCRYCAVALIQELRQKEAGHASQAR
jgi:hypothetical protein